MLFGLPSKSDMIVAPVVVIPDILSKNASLKLKFCEDNKKGKLPKVATIIHANEENKKVCLKLSLNSFSRLAKTKFVPLGGINLNNLSKLKIVNCESIAISSLIKDHTVIAQKNLK